MKQFGIYLMLVATILILTSCAGSTEKAEPTSKTTSTPIAKSNEDVKATITELIRKEDEAESKPDLPALDQMLHQDYIFSVDDFFAGKAKMFEDWKKRSEKQKPGEVGPVVTKYEDMKINVYGDTAVANYLVTFKEKNKEGKEVSRKYRVTVTLIKQDSRWQIVAAHGSTIPPQKKA